MQGLVMCAKCGDRMTVRYHLHGTRRVPDYVCQRGGIAHAEPICQLIVGGELDAAVGKLLVQAVTPLTLGVALAVQKELEKRCDPAAVVNGCPEARFSGF
ncbi:zinc ribbon domain-containing protein [Herbaspirillum sp. RV1423]|uniref:zinc ribbon domain-containing protein n=1 Tax=Herbaspirillum sp. RV1423 TaxID=1443993 RepID=UPI002100AF53|nr:MULTISPECIES: zinc ribbon domain-containing protein [Burkholderiales]